MYNWYIYQQEAKVKLGQIGRLTISGFSAVVSSLVGGVTCIACATTVLGFLGIGGMMFITKYKLALLSITLMFVLTSLYYNSRKVLGICSTCYIKH